ncbi:MAG: hypothetical protein FHK80_00795 [Azoarcus sp. PHD]|jgi:hypothetical protein|nr:MAG: hypothetical protein FHK80_00795 [Azoarcus sp. PHD]
MTKEERIRAECARRGLSLERTGQAWRVSGPGIDILATEISYFDQSDLNPNAHQPRQTERTRP